MGNVNKARLLAMTNTAVTSNGVQCAVFGTMFTFQRENHNSINLIQFNVEHQTPKNEFKHCIDDHFIQNLMCFAHFQQPNTSLAIQLI